MRRFTITKRFVFSASHELVHLPTDHPCAWLHSHDYRVDLILRSSDVDYHGFVIDHDSLFEFQRHIEAYLNHQHLNDVLGGAWFTTLENIARYLYEYAIGLSWGEYVHSVRVSEKPGEWADYSWCESGDE